MRKLKIAQIAPIWYPIPPEKYAGTEKIVYYLTEELVKRGHDVTLFASGNSKTSARLTYNRKRSLTEDKIPWEDIFLGLEHFAFSFKKIQESNFDIVHTHGGAKSVFFQNFIKTPLIYTSHGSLSPSSKKLPPLFEALRNYRESLNMCFISAAQRELCPIKFKNNWIVYNGIDINVFKFQPEPEDYFIWVGRVEPKKGVENAIMVAKKAKLKLYLVGKIDPERENYFKHTIKPLLSKKIKYLGELPQKNLVRLYGKAKALLFPLEWHEPFGLTMAESQACGTPVITFKLGSTSEVVKNKKTGFVVPFLDRNKKKNIKGILDAVKNVDKIKRIDCRKFVEENFTLEKMIDNYEKIYYKLAK